MKPLISTDSPLYLKRLVWALNEQPDGFYAPYAAFSFRCNRARLHKGELQVHSYSEGADWFTPNEDVFTDPYGRPIVASRKA